MSDHDDITRLPTDFDGCVRLFPLPELVVFPHAMQTLHIFEPRYCEMLMESLASDKLIAMATLLSGVGDLLSPKPTIASTVCIGKIVSHAETEDGRHNILLVGAKRAKLIREMDTNRTFRIAEVEVQFDVHSPIDPQQRKLLRAALLDAFAAVIPPSANAQQNLHELMSSQMGLGPITDIISFTLGLSSEAKLSLLAEVDIDRRARMLISILRKFFDSSQTPGEQPKKPPPGDFPPRFSVN
jgi:Lon protease-like protein